MGTPRQSHLEARLTRKARNWPIPTALIFRTLPLALIVMTGVAALHAGLANWIQGLNYLVAALPLAFAAAALWHAHRSGNRSARLYGAVYLATFWAFSVYSWQRIEQHKQLTNEHEAALAPTIAALAAYQQANSSYPEVLPEATSLPPVEHLKYQALGTDRSSYRLSFSHNILRLHVYEPDTGWRDEARQ